MIKSLPTLLSLLLILAVSSCKENNTVQNVKSDTFLVDVRTPAEYAGGTVGDAINIPLDEVTQNIDVFKGKSSITVFCQGGVRSGKAKKILESNGIENVINGGGWEDLKKKVNATKN